MTYWFFKNEKYNLSTSSKTKDSKLLVDSNEPNVSINNLIEENIGNTNNYSSNSPVLLPLRNFHSILSLDEHNFEFLDKTDISKGNFEDLNKFYGQIYEILYNHQKNNINPDFLNITKISNISAELNTQSCLGYDYTKKSINYSIEQLLSPLSITTSRRKNIAKLIEKILSQLNISQQLYNIIVLSLCILIHGLLLYTNIGISFNGGKDSVVMINLVCIANYLLNETEEINFNKSINIITNSKNNSNNNDVDQFKDLESKTESNNKRKITVFHLRETHSFPELDSFIEQFKQEFILPESGFSFESFEYVDMMKGLRGTTWDCIILGVRMSDYDDRIEEQKSIKIFCPTTGNWPKMMRIHPILFWNYYNIWDYIHAADLPYCTLYKQGYTSIGKTINTFPNPYLKCEYVSNQEYSSLESSTNSHSCDKCIKGYRPAWELKDGHLERAGRGTAR